MQAATKPHRLVLGFESEPAERLRLAQAGLNGRRTLEGRPGELWLAAERSSGGVLRLKPDAPCERLPARVPGWTASGLPQSSGSGLRLADAVPAGGSCLPRLEAARLADRMGEWSEAVRLYRLVLQSGCDDAHVHFRLAVLLRRTGGTCGEGCTTAGRRRICRRIGTSTAANLRMSMTCSALLSVHGSSGRRSAGVAQMEGRPGHGGSGRTGPLDPVDQVTGPVLESVGPAERASPTAQPMSTAWMASRMM